MDFREYLSENIVLLDGSTGTLLQRHGLKSSEGTETWNVRHPEIVQSIQKEYYDAGSNVVVTNTFAASAYKYTEISELEKIVSAAYENTAKARDNSGGNQEKFIGLNVGPLGALLEPFGELPFGEAVEIFRKGICAGLKCSPDLIVIETMGDVYEAKAALLAVKESTDLPVVVTHTYGKNARVMTGAGPETVVTILEALGADAVGVNCSYGPIQLQPIVREYLKYASVPVSFKPNAGLPKEIDGKLTYDIDEETFAKIVVSMTEEGVRLVGGCCGTLPAHIRLLGEMLQGRKPVAVREKEETRIASFTQTGTPAQAVILTAEEGKDPDALAELVLEEQECSNDLFGLKTADPEALERALFVFNGKPLVDLSAFAKKDLERAFAVAKKYGGVLYFPPETMPADLSESDIEALCSKYSIREKNIIRRL